MRRKVKEETTSGDIEVTDLPIKLKKKKDDELQEDILSPPPEIDPTDAEIESDYDSDDLEDLDDEIYVVEEGEYSSIYILPNGELAYIDEVNNILISYIDIDPSGAYEVNDLDTDESFVCENLLNELFSCENENTKQLTYDEYKEAKDTYSSFFENYKNLISEELEQISFEDYLLLRKFLKYCYNSYISLDKNNILYYDLKTKTIMGAKIDYDKDEISYCEGKYSVETFSKKFLFRDCQTILNIIRNNAELESSDNE